MFANRTALRLAVIFWAVLGSVFSLHSQAAEPRLAVAEVVQRSVPDVYVTDAVIEAVQQATIAAETTGRIKAIYFDVDDVVEPGSVLLRFTDKEQRARLARAEAAQKETEARRKQAEAEHGRITEVFAKKLVARSAMDKAIADLKAARQRLKAAEADVQQAQEQLEYTIIRAPYAGIVTKRHVNVGEQVRPGTALMTGFSLAKLRATASVPQAVVEAVRRHGEVSISLPESPSTAPVTSRDITIYPFADAASHRFTVRAELSALPAGFYPGMFVKAAFVVGERSLLVTPRSSVVHRSEVTAVYVVDAQGRISFRAVRVGKSQADEVEILAGLTVGEQVAQDPVAAGVLLKTQRAKQK
jgi:RND family efflux transporter MFP subunit